MKTYLVGGAVRDHLMGVYPKDKDFVVVGSSEQEMMDKGFEKVGADFPVFIHPTNGNEYALARTERKNGVGYNGFSADLGVDVTTKDGTQVKSLDGNLLQKFIDAGFSLDGDYNVEVLIQFFRQTNQ